MWGFDPALLTARAFILVLPCQEFSPGVVQVVGAAVRALLATATRAGSDPPLRCVGVDTEPGAAAAAADDPVRLPDVPVEALVLAELVLR